MNKRIKGNSSGWTKERRERMSLLIHHWKPWLKAGVKTSAGKEISKMNAVKHGGRSRIIKIIRKTINDIL